MYAYGEWTSEDEDLYAHTAAGISISQFICIYVSIYTCIYAYYCPCSQCMSAHMFTEMHAYVSGVHKRRHLNIHICTRTFRNANSMPGHVDCNVIHAHVDMDTCRKSVHIHVYVQTHIYLDARTYACTCARTYARTYANTYMYTQIRTCANTRKNVFIYVADVYPWHAHIQTPFAMGRKQEGRARWV